MAAPLPPLAFCRLRSPLRSVLRLATARCGHCATAARKVADCRRRQDRWSGRRPDRVSENHLARRERGRTSGNRRQQLPHKVRSAPLQSAHRV